MKKYERLRIYRESLKMTQKEFFERYDIEQRNASKYESGTSTIPDELEAELAADGLNLHWLATGKGEMLVQDDVFRIPLLTRDQAMHFDPAKEIPDWKANSGEYPDISLIPIPSRVMEYSTDLRAIVVFDSRMYPVMKSGDVAIFEATGWNGNGIHLYRMGDKLHITYAGGENNHFRLFSEIENEIMFDAKTYFCIGRVRAVVSDLFAYDWQETARKNIEQVLTELRASKANREKLFTESKE